MNNILFTDADLLTGSRPKRRRGNITIGKHRLPLCPETGKLRYRDHAQAADGLGSAKWKGRLDRHNGVETNRRETRAYKCPDCKGWHTTSLEAYSEPMSPTPVAALPDWQNRAIAQEPMQREQYLRNLGAMRAVYAAAQAA